MDSKNEKDTSFHLSENHFKWIISLQDLKTVKRIINPKFILAGRGNKVQIIAELVDSAINVIRVGLSRLEIIEELNTNMLFEFEIQNMYGLFLLQESIKFVFVNSVEEVFSRPFSIPMHWLVEYRFKIRGRLYSEYNDKEEMARSKTFLPESIIQLQEDFKMFLRTGQNADLTICIEEGNLKAHKFVLCARSPVFRRMFENEMKENKESKITLNDINKQTLKLFLNFLYTGVLDYDNVSFSETLIDLYATADKYEIPTLQKECRDVLVSFLSLDTVCILLKTSHLHNDDILKEKAVEFFCKHLSALERTDDWNEILETDPRLATYVLKQVSKQLSKS